MKKLLCMLAVVFGGALNADDSQLPAPFRGADENSKLGLDYRDMTVFLEKAVLVNPTSANRQKARKPKAEAGTKLRQRINVFTALEGNRVFVESLREDDVFKLVQAIRISLESIPDTAPLNLFSKNEQITYWINLYNITMLELLAERGRGNMKRLLTGKKSILKEKVLKVAGVDLSLDDIMFTILPAKAPGNPLVIYGPFQGIIGSPNLRPKAYQAGRLWRDLGENADNFINGNRGTMKKGSKTLEVSDFYKRHKAFFPDFENDLRAHLKRYLGGDEASIINTAKLNPKIKDWIIASIKGNYKSFGASTNTNGTALATAMVYGVGGEGNVIQAAATSSLMTSSMAEKVMSHPRFSATQIELLTKLNKQRLKRATRVQVDEIDEPDN